MYMMNKLTACFKEYQRAKRLSEIEEGVNQPNIWQKTGHRAGTSDECTTVSFWKNKFAEEALRVYPQMTEYMEPLEARIMQMENELGTVKNEYYELKEKIKDNEAITSV